MRRTFVKCAMLFEKRPQFLLFSTANGGTKDLFAKGWNFLSLNRRIYDCKLRNKKKHLIRVRKEHSPQLSILLYNCKLNKKEAL